MLTSRAAPQSKPPLEATLAALAGLECSHDCLLWLSTRDGTAFFDQLQVPSAVRPWFGRPQVRVAELLNPPLCESGNNAAAPMTLAELKEWLLT